MKKYKVLVLLSILVFVVSNFTYPVVNASDYIGKTDRTNLKIQDSSKIGDFNSNFFSLNIRAKYYIESNKHIRKVKNRLTISNQKFQLSAICTLGNLSKFPLSLAKEDEPLGGFSPLAPLYMIIVILIIVVLILIFLIKSE